MFEHELTEDYLLCNSISTYYLKLPNKVHAFTIQIEDEKYILINKNHTFYTQKLALVHELVHIDCKHLNNYNLSKMQHSEFEASTKAKELMDEKFA